MLLHFIYLFIAHLFHSPILFFSITTVDGSSLRNTMGRVLLTNLTVTQLSELCYNHDKGWGAFMYSHWCLSSFVGQQCNTVMLYKLVCNIHP